MAHKKKLQVFVSSTYTDLHEERQAAVEAILTAGHIPAGMELFAAGDQSQMSVIRRWIDESDVYLLILGGRYGSIEPESGKSYIELEYEYAVAQNKPFFAVVIEEDHLEKKVKSAGTKVIERDNPQKLKDFKAQVLGKLVKFWRDPRDIKLAILETMSEFSRRDDLTGWIPGSEAMNAGAVAEEMARLAKENAELRQQVANMSPDPASYNGLTFDGMYKILLEEEANISEFSPESIEVFNQVAEIFGDSKPGLIHLFWLSGNLFRQRHYLNFYLGQPPHGIMLRLAEFGLVVDEGSFSFILTETGRQLLLRLRLERDTRKAEELVRYNMPF
ncbi:MAG: DUF4062 domain-containing protein [Pyrinomonadaceae bacterium]